MNQLVRVLAVGTAALAFGVYAATAAQKEKQVRSTAESAAKAPSHRGIHASITGLFGWKVGIAADAFPKLTLIEVAQKAHELGVTSVEAFGSEQCSREITKTLDSGLSDDEIAVIKKNLADVKVSLAALRVDNLGTDDEARRRTFDVAAKLGVTAIITSPEPETLAVIDALANEYKVHVAVENGTRSKTPTYWDPKQLMSQIASRSEYIGVGANIGRWMQEGIKPVDGIAVVASRLVAVTLQDRSAIGAAGRPVPFGAGAADAKQFMFALGRLERPASLVSPSHCGNCSRALEGLKPIVIVLARSGSGYASADLSRSLAGFDNAAQPAMGDFVDSISRATPITSPDEVPAADKERIEAALPKEAPAKPKKARKLLVLDLCPAGGYYHTTIAYANLALALMGKQTGAYEATFSNDLDNLKYPKIKQFDAVFLNSTVGEDFVDPEVLNGLLRFVREGGGVAGLHGATYASMDLPEFGEMMGAQDGPHKVETATLRVDDLNSPLAKSFRGSELTSKLGGNEFTYEDEFYHFLPTGPYSRTKVHVLISIDTGKSDMSGWHVRPDNDYGLSWIKSYGKGRVFNCALGHTPTLFETPELASYILAGIQFILGDLPADTTPGAIPAATR